MTDFTAILSSDYQNFDYFKDEVLMKIFGNFDDSTAEDDYIRDNDSLREAADAANIKAIRKTGNIEILGSPLEVFEIIINNKSKISRSRIGIQNVVRRQLQTMGNAFMVFRYENPENRSWRFSYVYKGGSQKDSTTAKRYSYVFGNGNNVRTANERFNLLLGKIDSDGECLVTDQDLLDAFSVEALTKEFYDKIYSWYLWAQDIDLDVYFPNDPKIEDDDKEKINEKLIRLITRLIFVWFLKQKDNGKLIPFELFDTDCLVEILNDFDPLSISSGNYYNAILQNLFFATLNKKIKDRCFVQHHDKSASNQYGIKYFYRDLDNAPQIKYSEPQFIELMSRVPYLNGGLFECLDKVDKKNRRGYKEMLYDGFSCSDERFETGKRHFKKRAFVPNVLFFDDWKQRRITYISGEKTVTETVFVGGIVTLLQQYNFTVEENTPLEYDISLDPELLGKVFENLLGAFNPETKETVRKATGSYYTPQEVVNYMVNESVIQYLKTQCQQLDIENVDKILNYELHSNPYSRKETKEILSALYACKILDPACGSGAFPMGMLNQIVHLLAVLDPDNTLWKDIVVTKTQESDNKFLEELKKMTLQKFKQVYDDITDDADRQKKIIDIDNEFIRLRDEMVGNFAKPLMDSDYWRKLYLIQNCIFGVDIQPVAMQISKLRFFISLIVNQKTSDSKDDNYGIMPLPNLETKMVCANTLLRLENKGGDLVSAKTVDLKEKIFKLRERHFEIRDNDEKTKLRAQDEKLRDELREELLTNSMFTSEDAVKLAQWDPYDQNVSSDFFDADFMFNVQDGFDIVIGNPPYVRRTSIKDTAIKAAYEKLYESATNQYDMYLLFIEKGVLLLKNNGILCYINPIRFFNADYGFGCRKFIVKNCKILSVLDISQLPVFERALTYPCILSLNRNNCVDGNAIVYRKLYTLNDIKDVNKTTPILTNQSDILSDSEYKFLIDENHELKKIISTIDDTPDTVGSCFDIARGLPNSKVDFDGRKYFALKSKNVKRYYIDGEYVKINTNYGKIFDKEMIIMPRTVLYLQAMFKEPSVICLDRIYYLVSKTDKYSLKYVLGILNSCITNFCFDYYYKTTKVQGNYFDLNGNQIGSIHIPCATQKQQQPIITLVDRILAAKKSNPQADTSGLEREIDFLVYKLYGLNYDEVLTIDPKTVFSREEYETN